MSPNSLLYVDIIKKQQFKSNLFQYKSNFLTSKRIRFKYNKETLWQ